MVDERVGLVGLEGGGDGQVRLSVPVQNVHQLLLLDGAWRELTARSDSNAGVWYHRTWKEAVGAEVSY